MNGNDVIYHYDEKNDIYGIRYTEIIPVLIKAIQELSVKVDKIK